jgi:hypothetical protein
VKCPWKLFAWLQLLLASLCLLFEPHFWALSEFINAAIPLLGCLKGATPEYEGKLFIFLHWELGWPLPLMCVLVDDLIIYTGMQIRNSWVIPDPSPLFSDPIQSITFLLPLFVVCFFGSTGV